MLLHIELKFWILFCFTVLQITFEFHPFPLIFVGVMPLLELRILKIRRFPHFSLTCFDILSWNFAYEFVLLYYRPSSSVVNLRQFFLGVMPLLELRVMGIHSIPRFSLTCFDTLSWNFAYKFILLYYRSSASVVNSHQFLWEQCPFLDLEYWKYTVFRTFLLRALIYWAVICHKTLLNVL